MDLTPSISQYGFVLGIWHAETKHGCDPGRNGSIFTLRSEVMKKAEKEDKACIKVMAVGDDAIGMREELESQFRNPQFILEKPHLRGHFYEIA